MNVHEDKIIRLVDDRNLFEISKNQLRKDINNFELLCQDISIQNRKESFRLEEYLKKENRQLKHYIEDIKDEASRNFKLFDGIRDSFSTMSTQVAWNKFNIEKMDRIVRDVHVTVNMVQEMDTYIHRVMPINIQTQIYKSCMMSGDLRYRQRFEKYTSEVINQLLLIKNEPNFPFDKEEVTLPNIKSIEKQLALKRPRVTHTSPNLPDMSGEVKQSKFDMGKAIEEVKR